MTRKFRFWKCVLIVIFSCGLLPVYGQTDRATITGTITDANSAILSGVRVVVTNTDTGTATTATTNSVGLYVIKALPISIYSVEVNQPGFNAYKQTGISLIAAQVLKVDIRLSVGSRVETIDVNGGASLLETETSSVSMTMEQTAIRELPLNASGGRDALNLMVATVPTMSGTICSSCTQNFIHLAGTESMSNSVFVDGVESTAANQGAVATPGLDALQEMQIATTSTDAETGSASGGAQMFELKSGTNAFHGSAFYFYQNEGLNSNGWENNYFLSQCSSSDTACISSYKRPDYRFDDYGGSAGGPIWKDHTFIFGDYEYYSQANWSLNPTGETVPTPQMLTGDFSQLLTGGTRQGAISNSNGSPWINPCTGDVYQYGQIFDPTTQKVIDGQTCATPFPGNIIPTGRLSSVSQKMATIYSKYYTPTIKNKIYSNFPSDIGVPLETKKTFDIKVDHYFSERHHLSGSYNTVEWTSLGINGGLQYANNSGPLSSFFTGDGVNRMFRAIDNYSFSKNILNTFAVGYTRIPGLQSPQNPAKPSDYGINSTSNYMPVINFGTASNGVGYPTAATGVNLVAVWNGFHYQDTLAWQRGRHSFKFGGTFLAQQLNTSSGGNIQTYTFASDTGGPIDPSLTPFVGSGFANFMLGNVYNASEAITQSEYPRQKGFGLFAVDDFRVNPKLTLNLGLRWDVNLPGHEQAGRWENFNLGLRNPNWAPYYGAWQFSSGSGTTFYTKNDLHQFGPHIGAAYQVTSKLVARASYGVFYVPLGTLNSGYGANMPANQTALAFGVNQVLNTTEGTSAFNWDKGYPGVTTTPVLNIGTTSLGSFNSPLYIAPYMLYLGHTQNWYAGLEYQLAHNLLLDARYMGNRGGNLHDYGRSEYKNYPSWSTYQPLLTSGHIYDQINNIGDAAAIGISYPYAGFSGPAYSAIAAYPQAASKGAVVESFGDPSSNDSSAFDALIVEVKARNTHGLYLDYSYTLSKVTGGQYNLDNFANNWAYEAQNLDDWKQANHWIQPFDQRHLAKGYATYDLPIGRNQRWLNQYRALDYAVGGWTVGFYGSYGSGTPLGWVYSSLQLPYYFGPTRANFANGANAENMKNHFNRKSLNPVTPLAAGNNDFAKTSFATTTTAAPFGDTPLLFNHWRWNPGAANENLSIIKHFGLGPDGRINASVRADFFNAFNRHYFNPPDTNPQDATFGQVTSAYGNRVGQLGARIEW